MEVRRYGSEGAPVVLLHGGPGTPGYMAPVARGLEDAWRVYEPLQRLRGYAPLTVETHIEDLDEMLRAEFDDGAVSLVGSSWGGMLGLCFAARWPRRVSRIVVIGGGAWDRASRTEMQAIRAARMTDEIRQRVEIIEREVVGEQDPQHRDRLFQALFEAIHPLYCFDPATHDLEIVAFDSRGNQEVWLDLNRLEEEGVYPEAFRDITCPVTLVHGDYDPHPGPTIHRSLQAHVRDLSYHEIADCGHFPWIEREARDEFFRVLRAALAN